VTSQRRYRDARAGPVVGEALPRPGGEAARLNGLGRLGVVAVGLAVVAAAVFVLRTAILPATAVPTFVRRLTLVNPTSYEIQVDVAGSSADGWLDLGEIAPKSARTVEEVIDQGQRWTFRVRRAQVGDAQLVVSRQELRRFGWRMTIPALFIEHLGAQGPLVPRSPELDDVDAGVPRL
jgi:hypothetical protein